MRGGTAGSAVRILGVVMGALVGDRRRRFKGTRANSLCRSATREGHLALRSPGAGISRSEKRKLATAPSPVTYPAWDFSSDPRSKVDDDKASDSVGHGHGTLQQQVGDVLRLRSTEPTKDMVVVRPPEVADVAWHGVEDTVARGM